MRELITQALVNQTRPIHKFDKHSMRWTEIFITKDEGVVRIYSKRDKKGYKDPIHISDMTREDWEALSDEVLLWSYTFVIMRSSMMM